MSDDTANEFLELEILGTIEEQCLTGSAKELAKFIKEHFVVKSPNLQNKVLYQFETPSASDRGKAWVARNRNGIPTGLLYFNGDSRQWTTVDVSPNNRGRIFYRFDSSLASPDIPDDYILDDDPALVAQRIFDDNGNLKYAWIRHINSVF